MSKYKLWYKPSNTVGADSNGQKKYVHLGWEMAEDSDVIEDIFLKKVELSLADKHALFHTTQDVEIRVEVV